MYRLLKIATVFKNSTRNCSSESIGKAISIATTATTSPDRKYMIIDITNNKDTKSNEKLKYPLIWLRDNCQCSDCFHMQSKSRTIDWTKFDFKNAIPKSVSLEVTWQDNHISTYNIDWLLDRSFTAESRQRYLNNGYRPKPILWSKDQFQLEEFQADDVLNSDKGLHRWLDTLTRYGVVLIKGAALTQDQCLKLANRVGFIRETHYGKEYAVRADPNAKNFAYTSNALQFHTDLPYYDYMPGATLLHCISQTKSPGAFNLLTDGSYVAERLKQENPEMFECLTKAMVNWCDYGEDGGNRFETIFRNPVICLDYEGNLSRINHSIPQRDTFFSIDVEKVDSWYVAMKTFVNLLYDEAVYFKLDPGDILAFSNIQLLHGRTAYVDKEGDVRHLVGAYLDWDEIYSRLRLLANNKRS